MQTAVYSVDNDITMVCVQEDRFCRIMTHFDAPNCLDRIVCKWSKANIAYCGKIPH